MPYIKFSYSKNKDLEFALHFVSREPLNKNFLRMYLPKKLVRILTLPLEDRKKRVTKFIEDEYKRRGAELTESYEEVRAEWKKVKSPYFALLRILFEGHPWSKDVFKGYGTIFLCYPRWIDQKAFLFPLEHKNPNYRVIVIAHEMMHFLFFDYIQKKYRLKQDSVLPRKDKRYVWKVSEAFNTLIEGWPPFQNIFHSNPRPYPETTKIYKEMEKFWNKEQNVPALLDKMLKQ